MKKRILIGLCVCLFVVLYIVYLTNFKNVRQVINPAVSVLDSNEVYKDIKLKYYSVIDEYGQIGFVEPVEGSYSDYNTYYGNIILLHLNQKIDVNLFEEIDSDLLQDDYMQRKGNESFENIERLYYYAHLLDNSNLDYEYNNMENHLKKWISTSYKTGYFLDDITAAEISVYDEEYIESVKLSYTFYTLYVERKYQQLSETNLKEIANWLTNSTNCNSVTCLKTKLDIFKLIGHPIPKDFVKMLNNQKELLDNVKTLQDVYSLVEIMKTLNVSIDLDNAYYDELILKLEMLDMSDLQGIYYVLKILDNNENLVPSELKKSIVDKLVFYRYDNSRFSIITKYQLNAKQLKIYHDFCRILAIEGRDQIITEYINVVSEKDMDYYDIYSAVLLDAIYGNDSSSMFNKEYFIDRLRKFTVNGRPECSYHIKSLLIIEPYIGIDDLPIAITDYFKILESDIDYELDLYDLMLIDSIMDIEQGIVGNKIYDEIENQDYLDSDELLGLKLAYKYKIMLKLNRNDSIKNILELVDKLRINGGYKKTTTDNFADLQATHLLLEAQAQHQYIKDSKEKMED